MARWAVAVAAVVVVVVVVFGRRGDAKTPAEEAPGLPLFLTPFLRVGHCEVGGNKTGK
ncbi:hypothetical protein E2C01_084170 [Portunus trituberculatus]|uniref:Uncharacterized protein n=1 Tax=Portunus trituberculatus TaxID=210409 RepID=A0A5B7J437_PORTR|nr:hypothetical protein [Portunus trituberculatus]